MRSMTKALTSLVTVAVVSACAVPSPTLVEQEIVRTEIEESYPVRITRATVYREDGKIVVSGEAAFPAGQWFGAFRGHIDIDVVVPGKETLKTRNVSLIRMRIPKKRGRRATFVSRRAVYISRYEGELPKGTIVKVAYHEGSHEKSS